MYISLNLSELTPTTLAAIAVNLIENINSGVNTTHTNRLTIAKVFDQLSAIVGDEAVDVIHEAGGDTVALRVILLEFA